MSKPLEPEIVLSYPITSLFGIKLNMAPHLYGVKVNTHITTPVTTQISHVSVTASTVSILSMFRLLYCGLYRRSVVTTQWKKCYIDGN